MAKSPKESPLQTGEPETAAPEPVAPARYYLGPAVKLGEFWLQPETLFRELPPAVAQAAAQDPDLSRLLVPVADLGAALRRRGRPESEEARAAQAVAARYQTKRGSQ